MSDGTCVVALGDRGTGKSTLIRRLALAEATTERGEVRAGYLAIYVTPNGEETDPWPGVSYEAEELEALAADEGGEYPGLVVCRGGPRAYDVAARVALDVCRELVVVFVVDELHRVLKHNFSDQLALAEVFHEGRHRRIRLFGISQWPARIDSRVLYAADETYWFRLHAPGNLNWIARNYSVEAADEVASLPDYRYVHVEEDRPPASWRWRSDRRRPPPAEST